MSYLFSDIVIVGVGLLGGSLGLSVKKNRLASRVWGVARRESSAQEALQFGTVDFAFTSFDDLWSTLKEQLVQSDSDNAPILFIIAAPVGVIAAQVVEINRRAIGEPLGRPILITDVGSTKKELLDTLATTTWGDGVIFIGSHPIAGSEKSGAAHSVAHLFENKTTIISPLDSGFSKSSGSGIDEKISLLERFWQAVGSRTIRIDAESHDQLLAKTSHLPHLLSVALMNLVSPEEWSFTGTGFFDMTRLAAGSPEVWSDIFLSNRKAIIVAISETEQSLARWKELLGGSEQSEIITLLTEAEKNRHALGSRY